MAKSAIRFLGGICMAKLILIDGSSLLHRAFYALPLLSNSRGEYTNAVYGFINMLNKLLEGQKPDFLLVCFIELYFIYV